MAITPHTILLTGDDIGEIENHLTAGATITPGMLIEKYSNSGVTCWRPASAAAGMTEMAVALENRLSNKGIDDNYSAGDLVIAHHLEPGDVWYGILLNGAAAANGDLIQSDGTGKLKAATATTATANVGQFRSLDNLGTVGADTRVRAQKI